MAQEWPGASWPGGPPGAPHQAVYSDLSAELTSRELKRESSLPAVRQEPPTRPVTRALLPASGPRPPHPLLGEGKEHKDPGGLGGGGGGPVLLAAASLTLLSVPVLIGLRGGSDRLKSGTFGFKENIRWRQHLPRTS